MARQQELCPCSTYSFAAVDNGRCRQSRSSVRNSHSFPRPGRSRDWKKQGDDDSNLQVTRNAGAGSCCSVLTPPRLLKGCPGKSAWFCSLPSQNKPPTAIKGLC